MENLQKFAPGTKIVIVEDDKFLGGLVSKKLIDEAAGAGFDAVKFQKRTIDLVYTKEFLEKIISIFEKLILDKSIFMTYKLFYNLLQNNLQSNWGLGSYCCLNSSSITSL